MSAWRRYLLGCFSSSARRQNFAAASPRFQIAPLSQNRSTVANDCEPVDSASLSDSPQVSQSTVTINHLPDTILAEIFSYLVPLERLKVSQVCIRWEQAVQFSWLDVTTLDLSSIPPLEARMILARSPKLNLILATNQRLSFEEIDTTTCSKGLTIKANNVKVLVPRARIPSIIWSSVFQRGIPKEIGQLSYESITRLQITESRRDGLFDAFGRLPNLECLALAGKLNIHGGIPIEPLMSVFIKAISKMTKLRELSLVNAQLEDPFELCAIDSNAVLSLVVLADLYETLQNLEVLIVVSQARFKHKQLVTTLPRWIASSRKLRLFVCAVNISRIPDDVKPVISEECDCDRSCLHPRPTFNVFIGADVARAFSFSKSCSTKMWVVDDGQLAAVVRSSTKISEIFEDFWVTSCL